MNLKEKYGVAKVTPLVTETETINYLKDYEAEEVCSVHLQTLLNLAKAYGVETAGRIISPNHRDIFINAVEASLDWAQNVSDEEFALYKELVARQKETTQSEKIDRLRENAEYDFQRLQRLQMVLCNAVTLLAKRYDTLEETFAVLTDECGLTRDELWACNLHDFDELLSRTVKTTAGEIPIGDYCDIVAQQAGFCDYEDMRASGCKLGNSCDEAYERFIGLRIETVTE